MDINFKIILSKYFNYRLLNADCEGPARLLKHSMPDSVAGVPGGLGGHNYGTFYVQHMAKIGMVRQGDSVVPEGISSSLRDFIVFFFLLKFFK